MGLNACKFHWYTHTNSHNYYHCAPSSCWIDANNDNHGTIWSFHGPAIAIICVSTDF